MEVDPRTWLEVLDEAACWRLLTTQPVGRLIVLVDGRIEVFPINYAVHERAVYVRTAPGTKVAGVGGEAVFEVDEAAWMLTQGWSVIARGRLEAVTDPDEIAAAEQLPLRPWADSDKPHFLRLVTEEITGRQVPGSHLRD
ncbi:MAG TPA: pyridoxamine 5'-phosphate oxidase family protein [Acidimicrobiales bacterium]|nr:pyridoxamine 5'-phosphate oxidase family protein [Acidimicrobiales bacterium]